MVCLFPSFFLFAFTMEMLGMSPSQRFVRAARKGDLNKMRTIYEKNPGLDINGPISERLPANALHHAIMRDEFVPLFVVFFLVTDAPSSCQCPDGGVPNWPPGNQQAQKDVGQSVLSFYDHVPRTEYQGKKDKFK